MALRSTKPALAKLAFGYTITPADQAILVSYGQSEIGTTLVTVADDIGAIWGRVRATKQITTKKLVP